MLFNSLHFLAFFPLVTAGYLLLPHRFRWVWLLVASCYFYMAFMPIYVVILLIVIVIDYVAGILIEQAEGKKRKVYLIVSLCTNIGILALFKYYNFLNTNLTALLWLGHIHNPIPVLEILLPLGLSFHTFQSMSYTIEVYRGKFEAEKHFGLYALYVMYYPQLVAGPIERPQNILPQLHARYFLNDRDVLDGLKLMLWGMFKKVVIADNLGVFVNGVYNHPADHVGLPVLLATYFFAFQIYCDFSGYSDIAIGASQVMGIRLMDNFNRPYAARSISEFWSRWHISLSTWFRDYVYIPIGGSRVSEYRTLWNVFIVFAISGLWHGANWTFVVWGSLHGAFYVVSSLTKTLRVRLKNLIGLTKFPRLEKAIQIFTTFHLVVFSWIFFRANSVGDAWLIINNMVRGFTKLQYDIYGLPVLNTGITKLGISKEQFSVALLALVLMEILQLIEGKYGMRKFMGTRHAFVRWTILSVLMWLIFLAGEFGETQFIYFVF
jgi:alginate O-acetyltransferase complex protein AlgI